MTDPVYEKIRRDPTLLHREVQAFLTQQLTCKSPQQQKVIQELIAQHKANGLTRPSQEVILQAALARTL